jgi:hypothetical protein
MGGKFYLLAGLLLFIIIIILFLLMNNGQLPGIFHKDSGTEGKKPTTSSSGLGAVSSLANRNGDINDPSTPRPLLTLEEFFNGNQDAGSIGYNFYPIQPTPDEFYRVFKAIRERPMVADVRVEIMDQVDDDSWPTTDTIWIITSADPNEVTQWIPDSMKADDILIGFPTEVPLEPYKIPAGFQAIGIWWD